MDRHGMIPDAFESMCRLRRARVLYTIPTIHNPTTVTLSENRRHDIAEIAARAGVMIFEDAVHHRLAAAPPRPFASIAPQQTFFVASLSKVVAGGLRVAFLAAPEPWTERLAHGIWATQWMSAPLCAEVATGWINDGTANDVVRRKRREARDRLEIVLNRIDGTRLAAERGGYHAWMELPDAWSATEFAHEARRRGAAVSAAEAFAVGPDDPPRAVRVSLSGPLTRGALDDGAQILADMLRSGPGRGPAIV
ncbi:MAG: PLP-dependent aminotransferase family protein [Candidatus Krumholzibacteriota bacterium]|nr:PLP-dependent aminotransferase family protein [Candidatus Krumholzibacteriota bacterium]